MPGLTMTRHPGLPRFPRLRYRGWWCLLAAFSIMGILGGRASWPHVYFSAVPIPSVVPTGPTYSVGMVEAGFSGQPDQWLGRTVWVRATWASLCPPPGGWGGCAMGAPGQSMYWLVDPSGRRLPLEKTSDAPVPPSAIPPNARTMLGPLGYYRVRLLRLAPAFCRWDGQDPGSQGIMDTAPCLGAVLQQ